MSRGWNKTDAFGHFGVVLDNVRWSWSGLSSDRRKAAILLWQDGVKRSADGSWAYEDDKELNAEWRRRPGHGARVEHLKHIQAELEGRFYAVIARARDVDADPREIESCFPQEGVVWQVKSFDPGTGAFTAQATQL